MKCSDDGLIRTPTTFGMRWPLGGQLILEVDGVLRRCTYLGFDGLFRVWRDDGLPRRRPVLSP